MLAGGYKLGCMIGLVSFVLPTAGDAVPVYALATFISGAIGLCAQLIANRQKNAEAKEARELVNLRYEHDRQEREAHRREIKEELASAAAASEQTLSSQNTNLRRALAAEIERAAAATQARSDANGRKLAALISAPPGPHASEPNDIP